MRRAVVAALAFFSFALAVACNAILGNDDGVYTPAPGADAAPPGDASRDVSADAIADGGGADGQRPDATPLGDAGALPTEIAVGLDEPAEIVADETELYFTIAGGLDAGAAQGIWRVSVQDAGATQTPFALTQPGPANLTMDANNVYWSVQNAEIRTCARASTCIAVASKVTTANALPGGIVSDGNLGMYWTVPATNAVYGCMRGNCATAAPLTTSQSKPTELAFLAGKLYWSNHGTGANDGTIAGCDISSGCGTIDTYGAPMAAPGPLVVNATGIYFTDPGAPNGSDGLVGSLPLQNAMPVKELANAQPYPVRIAAVGSDVYWVNGGDQTVWHADGVNAPNRLASGGTKLVAIAANSTGIYWVDRGHAGMSDGRILRLSR